MPYTAEKPPLPRSLDELKATIPGWGVDKNPEDRPAYPRERFDLASTGAHWHFPDRQPETEPRERSLEHLQLTPVFGTSVPLRGLSGMIRRYSYDNVSEGPLRHWLLLMAADRIDVIESRVEALLSGHPDNPIAETGIKAEFTRHGLRSRLGRGRADLAHQPLDALLVAAPWIVGAAAIYMLSRRVAESRS